MKKHLAETFLTGKNLHTNILFLGRSLTEKIVVLTDMAYMTAKNNIKYQGISFLGSGKVGGEGGWGR